MSCASQNEYMSSNSGSNSLTAAMLYAWRPISGRPDRPTGGFKRIVGVDVRLDQEELELGRDHRLPAVRLVELQHPPQHVARRHGDGAAVAVEAIVNHLRGGLGGPGHHPHRLRVGLQHDVDVRGVHRALIVRIVAGDRLQEYRLGQPHALLFGEFLRRHELAARDARHVRDDGLDFRDAVFLQKLLNRAGHKSPSACCAPPGGFAEGLEQRAGKRVLLELPFRMPLQAQRETLRVGDPERLDDAIRCASFHGESAAQRRRFPANAGN